mmetsp:Transcript_31924/g.32544  ORF Transcript_31924/g.32544 Transcript_31924/m.32544 type:complete len:283 (+) Transcript_31924:205-1053(+)
MIFSVLLISTLSLIIVSILAEKVKLTVSDGKVVKEAEFALRELQKLSDSEVYESLSISKIVNAESEIGIFHFNMMLTIELTSPYFASGQLTESYKIIIMTHKEDGVKSFAINEFPVMNEDAIETYWIRKVERKRREREESFRRMEIESILLDDWKGTNRKNSHDDPSPGEEEEEEEEEGSRDDECVERGEREDGEDVMGSDDPEDEDEEDEEYGQPQPQGEHIEEKDSEQLDDNIDMDMDMDMDGENTSEGEESVEEEEEELKPRHLRFVPRFLISHWRATL